ncbi:YhcH/YjgK/YiaL family protein [Rahnella sp. AA]|uniref:YhcH/YjgK/YiaL family protein n=1 Tax=Rahnella sp. AA TaxID=2057180 RepID=UPI000C32ACB3|nr:YhcH/YjgK/YiaL family protein [Rahnella sp. AA]PKE32411.1 YhcH/YjgK/YiaL family protein [Rahnella sp. AA]
MISGNITHWNKEKPAFHAVFSQVIDYIKNNDLASLATGKYPVIEDKLICIIQSYPTIELSESRPESHVQFIDLQYLIEGEEIIGFSTLSPSSRIVEDNAHANDMIYYDMSTQQDVLTLNAHDFCVFFPGDIHRTRGKVNQPVTIKKAVFKIHLSLLG